MRQRFEERYIGRIHSLVRLTEAQNPFFAGLEDRLGEYRAVQTPDPRPLRRAGPLHPALGAGEARDDLPQQPLRARSGETGHVVYLEKADAFFATLRAFLEAKSTTY